MVEETAGTVKDIKSVSSALKMAELRRMAKKILKMNLNVLKVLQKLSLGVEKKRKF
jgi:hypothetical protein